MTTMWLVLCGIFLIIEMFTVSFLMFFPGIGAFLAFAIALLGANTTVQVIIFVLTTTFLIIFVRPIATKLFKTKNTSMNSNALIGKTGIVLKDIVSDLHTGQVKVQGEIWTAICEEGKTIPKDTMITVEAISGVKLIVKEIS